MAKMLLTIQVFYDNTDAIEDDQTDAEYADSDAKYFAEGGLSVEDLLIGADALAQARVEVLDGPDAGHIMGATLTRETVESVLAKRAPLTI